ncbi:DinB family protein [Namhaeicola litoreus]|uniref:DinB family protein n=1 Tax=Namhaeicola litoreus TaxID=1052145 RepID=A0ABW3Y2Z9_9FLAO
MNEINKEEYAPFYSGYIENALNSGLSLLDLLKENKTNTLNFFKQIPRAKYLYQYAEKKWTVLELLQHLIDAERVFAYRALRFSREDKTPLPGFEENDYVENSRANQRDMESLINEFQTVRDASISLFTSFNENDFAKIGLASGSNMSVRAVGFIISGHSIHHIKIIQERYL